MGSGSSRRRGPAGRAGQSRDLPGAAPAAGEGAAAPAGPGPRAPAGGGSGAEAAGGGGGAPLQQAALSARSPPGPENNNLDHQLLQGQGGALTSQLLAPLMSPGGQDQVDLIDSMGYSGQSLQKICHCSPFGRCPESNQKPLGQSTISYDYSEEELMASIEREYCR